MRVRVCWSKVDEHGIIVMIESSLRLVQATFIALTLPASFPFVKACQHRLLDRNYFRPSRLGLKRAGILKHVALYSGLNGLGSPFGFETSQPMRVSLPLAAAKWPGEPVWV